MIWHPRPKDAVVFHISQPLLRLLWPFREPRSACPENQHATVLPVLFTRLGKRIVHQVFGDFEIPRWAFSRLLTWSSVVSFPQVAKTLLPTPAKTFGWNQVVAKPRFVWSLTEHDAPVRNSKGFNGYQQMLHNSAFTYHIFTYHIISYHIYQISYIMYHVSCIIYHIIFIV